MGQEIWLEVRSEGWDNIIKRRQISPEKAKQDIIDYYRETKIKNLTNNDGRNSKQRDLVLKYLNYERSFKIFTYTLKKNELLVKDIKKRVEMYDQKLGDLSVKSLLKENNGERHDL